MQRNLVKGEGPLDAKIILIGEAPGKTENALGRPFMGASGNLQNGWWHDVGLRRQEIRIENLCEQMPRTGNIESVSTEELVVWIRSLRERVSNLGNPCVLVPTGNYATFALTGKGKVRAALRKALGEEINATDAEKKAGITKLRGSLYPYTDLNGRGMKLIPTIHPAWFLRGNMKKQGRALSDWKKIRREAEAGSVFEKVERVHVIEPTEYEVSHYVSWVESNQDQLLLSTDIETWGNSLSCVGFSHSPTYSITIPTTPVATREIMLPYIKRLWECRSPKIMQNGFYDSYWMHFFGIKPTNYLWDTLAMAHAMNTAGEFSLDYLCSVHLNNYQYWKDEAKDAEEIKKYAKDLNALWCVDEETEALTDKGWKKRKDLKRGEKILAFDSKSHTCRWERIKEFGDFEIDEPMVSFNWSGREIALTTQNHRWWAKHGTKGKYKERKSKQWIPDQRNWRIPTAVPTNVLPTEKYFSDDFIKLFAWIIAEGSVRRKKPHHKPEMVIYQGVKSIHNAEIDYLVYKWFGSKRDMGNSEYCWRLPSKYTTSFWRWLREDVKSPIWDFYLKLTKEQVELFTQTLIKGDGDWQTGPWGQLIQHKKSPLLSDLQAALVFAGYGSSWKTYENNVCDRLYPFKNGKEIIPARGVDKHVKGKVWCPVVETGYWMARRNGLTYVTGNTYNGLDCTYTYELFEVLQGKLIELELMNYYFLHYVGLYGPLMDMMTQGVVVDTKKQKAWFKELIGKCGEIRERLLEVAGTDLFAVKDFSNKKLMTYFYTTLKIPKQMKWTKGAHKASLDKTALNKIILASGVPKTRLKFEPAKEPAMMIKEYRRKKKLSDFMKGAWDRDGRIRCSYKFTTEAGRLASSKNPKRKGYNLQNPDREIRDTFLPDPGCVFVKIDMSQIEDRQVKMYTGKKRMIEMANLRPDVFDAHKYNASRIFSCNESDVTYRMRDLGKKAVHGAQRGLHGKRLSENILNDTGKLVPIKECQRMLDAYLKDHWEINEIYFPYIRKIAWDNKCLTNTWGRSIWFEYDRVDDDLYRRLYSFLPQSECADLMNQWGVKEAWNLIKTHRMKTRLNLQVHDEIIASCPPDEAWSYALHMVWSLERPREIRGNVLRVPATVTVAESWKDKRFEFKALPERDEFEMVVNEVWKEVG